MSNSQQPITVELLAAEFLKRYRQGESPRVSEYLTRYPQLAEEINRLFPEILKRENLKVVDEIVSGASPASNDFGHFGDYRIIREVGRGGMGVVYEAEQVSLGRRVALKVLPNEMLANPRHRIRFEREARAAAKLHHTNIVPVFGVGESNGQLYYVMQFIDGLSLNEVLAELKALRDKSSVVALPKVSQPQEIRPDISAADVAKSLLAGALPKQVDHIVDTPVEAWQIEATVTYEKDSSISDTPVVMLPRPDDRSKSDRRLDLSGGSNSAVALPGSISKADGSSTKQTTYWESIAQIGHQVASALDYAHGQGVLHRDIKPANLVLDLKGTVWVTDFGLAKLDDDHGLTQTGDVLGTLRYIAPETFRGQADRRSEVYSLGLTLYEMLAFRPAFDQTNRIALIDKVMSAQVDPLGVLNPEVTKDLQTIIHKAIDSDPAHRYQTARELADELQRFIDDEPIKARRISSFERLTRWSRHNKGLAASLSTLALLVTVIAITSTIAAGYFRSLSSQLNTTVSTLTSTKYSLTEAGKEAETARIKAEKKSEEAEAARRASQTTLADMQTERGLLSAAQSDASTAMLWFATAATQTPHDPIRQANNRLRARNWMRETVLPVALLTDPVYGEPFQLEFQPRGELLLSWKPGSVQVWNLHLEQSLGWTANVSRATAVAWAPDGRRLAIGFPSGELQFRNVPSGEIALRLNHPQQIESIAYSRDGTRIAISSQITQVWKLAAEPVLEHVFKHPDIVQSMVFHFSGTQLATACRDNQARVFAVGDNAMGSEPLFSPLPHHPDLGGPPVFVNANRQLITVNKTTGKLGWWDAATGKDVTPSGADMEIGYVKKLTGSLDGRSFAASGGYFGTVWQLDGQRSDLSHVNDVVGLAFNPDGTRLLTGCEDWMARMWDVSKSDRPVITIPQMEGVRLCAFSDDGTLIATNSWTGIRVWRLPDQNLIVGHAENWNTRFFRPRASFDQRLATLGRWHESPIAASPLSALTVVVGQTGKPAGPPISVSQIVDSCVCGDNRSVAIISEFEQTGKLSIFDVATGKELIPSIKLPCVPQSVAARPGSSHVAVLCKNGHVMVTDHRDGKVLHDFAEDVVGQTHLFPRVTYTHDGSSLIVLTPRSEIAVRDAETGRLRYPPIHPQVGFNICRTLTISSDDQWLATGVNGQNAVQVWNLATGQAASERLPHPGDFYGIFSIAFSPDGQWILSGNKDGRARLWNWRTGKLACPPLQHSDEVLDVAFMGNGKYAVTGVRHGTARIWELTTGKMIAPPTRYPVPKNTSTETVTILGQHVLMGADRYPVLDLAPLLQEPTQSIESLQTLAELATGGRVELGELSGLAAPDWRERWERFQDRELTTEAIAGMLARELDKANDSVSRHNIAERAARKGTVLVELDRLRPNVPQLQEALAKFSEKSNDTAAAAKHRERAIALYEQQCAAQPHDDSLARYLARLINDNQKLTWNVLKIQQTHSRDGAILKTRDDGSILASGNHSLGDIYTLTATTDTKPVAAIRLEVLPDNSLPFNGPGRHDSGNFQLSAFRVFRHRIKDDKSVQPVRIADAWASYTYPAPSINVLGTIHEERKQVWHVFGRPGQTHYAIYLLEQPLTLEPGESLVIELKHHQVDPAINLGCFRLSVTDNPKILARERDHLAVEGQTLPGSLELAIAYLNRGQPGKARDLIARIPEPKEFSEVGVRLLLLTETFKQLDQPKVAREQYDKLIDWLHDNTIPSYLNSRVIALMQTIGGLNERKASSMLEQWVIENQIHRITQQIESNPEVPDNFKQRGELFSRLGKWRQCADDRLQHRTLTPQNRELWMDAACALLMAEDLPGYQQLCTEMLKQFRDSKELFDAVHVCKVCLLRPGTVDINDLPIEVLRTGATAKDVNVTSPWLTVDYALVLMRQGNAKEVLELVASIPKEQITTFTLQGAMLQAMSEHQLGMTDQARKTLAEASKYVYPELRAPANSDDSNLFPTSASRLHYNLIIIEILRREAAALIEGGK